MAVVTGPDAQAENRGESAAIRGVVRAVRQATISTETALRAVAVPYREGDRFKQGDVLVSFDCRRQIAEHEAALAAHREAVLNYDSNVILDRYKAVGRNDVEISRARADKAKADISSLAPRLDECTFVAPFDGRVVEVGVRAHERTVPQRPFLSIIDDRHLEIEAIAPSSIVASLLPGVAFAFKLDELGGHRVSAEISSIAAVVDPVSKTVKVIGVIKDQRADILAGMSGTAHFFTGK